MNYLSFLFVITVGLFTFRVAWMIYEYDPDSSPLLCSCSCSDATMTSTDLSARVEYKGFRGNASCTCREFLVPRIGQYAMSVSANETCELCKCGPVFDQDCNGGYMSFSAMFAVVTYTVGAMTCLMTLGACINASCFPKKRHSRSRRSGYQRIGVEDGNRIFALSREGIKLKDHLEVMKEQRKEQTNLIDNTLIGNEYHKFYKTYQCQ